MRASVVKLDAARRSRLFDVAGQLVHDMYPNATYARGRADDGTPWVLYAIPGLIEVLISGPHGQYLVEVNDLTKGHPSAHRERSSRGALAPLEPYIRRRDEGLQTA